MRDLPRLLLLLLVSLATFAGDCGGGDDSLEPVEPSTSPEDETEDPVLIPPDAPPSSPEPPPPSFTCGDGACDAEESCGSCASDCGVCVDEDGEEEKLLGFINDARATGLSCGVYGWQPPAGPLTFQDDLNAAAYAHSLDMGTQGYFAHESLDGRTPEQRVIAAGYPGAFRGEDLAAGYVNALQTFEGWRTSDGHCRVMLSPSASEAGIGYAVVEGSPYIHYWTLNIGAP